MGNEMCKEYQCKPCKGEMQINDEIDNENQVL